MKKGSSFLQGYNPQEDRIVYDSCCGGGHGHHSTGHEHAGMGHGMGTTAPPQAIGTFIAGSHEHVHAHTGGSGSRYQCPMQCEGDKTYEDPGRCPECNMNMVEI